MTKTEKRLIIFSLWLKSEEADKPKHSEHKMLKKQKKPFLLGCSNSLFRNWSFRQHFGDMNVEN